MFGLFFLSLSGNRTDDVIKCIIHELPCIDEMDS
jgi:hypothetical protein